MITNSLNPVSEHFRGRKIPKFVDSHYINREHSNKHAFLFHAHQDKAELYFVCAGSTRYMVGDHFYNISEGDIVICSQGVMHGESFMDFHDDSSISIGISNLFLEELPENILCGPNVDPVIHTGILADQVRGIFQLVYSLSAGKKPDLEICTTLTISLVLFVTEMISSRSRRRVNEAGITPSYMAAKRIRNCIDENFSSFLSVADIAKRMNISESYASHVFKDYYGISPKQYLTERRLGEAQKLLQLTDLSVNETSEASGFSRTSHFITIFQKYIGLSPARYRASLANMKVSERDSAEKKQEYTLTGTDL